MFGQCLASKGIVKGTVGTLSRALCLWVFIAYKCIVYIYIKILIFGGYKMVFLRVTNRVFRSGYTLPSIPCLKL